MVAKQSHRSLWLFCVLALATFVSTTCLAPCMLAADKPDAKKPDARKGDAKKPDAAKKESKKESKKDVKSDGLDGIDSAVKLIPKDAAFFVSLLRNREQVEAIRGSNAWAKILEMPSVQSLMTLYKTQAENPATGPGKFAFAMKNPEMRKIVDLLAEMGSDEMFFYGDNNCVDFLELVQNIAGALRYGPMVLQVSGQTAGRGPNEIQAAVLMAALADNMDQIAIPDAIAGFKLKNTDLAKEQLVKLEAIANILLESNELTKGRFKKTKVGDHDYLVLNLDGNMIPWSALPLEKLKSAEAEEGDAEKIIERLKGLELVITLGLRDDCLIVSIGSSTECLEKLGSPDRLIDRPEFKPLEKFAGKPLTSLSYVSEAMIAQTNSGSQNIDQLSELADRLLPATKLSEEQQDRIRKDVEALVEDLEKMVGEPGATMAFSFLADRGIESYQYAWGDAPVIGSKPLTLLQHVGGSPALGAVGRFKVSLDDYDRIAKWIPVGYGYFKEFGLPTLAEEEREKAEKFLVDAIPVVERLHKANREMLIPSLADGQLALVIDTKLKSKHFMEAMPVTDKAMPMIEPAIVLGVSDAALLRKACAEYREGINDLLNAVRKIEGTEVPEWLVIPEAEVVDAKNGELLRFDLPETWGVDKKIAPHFGIAKDVAVLTVSKGHAERLLKSTPLAVGGTLEKTNRPLAGAVWLQWSALLEAAKPWIDFAVERAGQPDVEASVQESPVGPQVQTVVDVLKAVRTISSEVYMENNTLVSHSLVEISDIEK